MKRSTHQNSRLGAALGLLAAAGLAHSALAQVTWSDGSGSRTAFIQTAPHAAPHAAHNQATRTIVRNNDDRTMIMSGTNENGDRYEIKVKNDDIRATLNGQPVPEDRIRIGDSSIELLDAQGGVVATMNTSQPTPPAHPGITVASPAFPRVVTRWGSALGAAGADDQIFATTIASEPPRVMVGINMSDVDPTIREHFGLDEDAGFVIDNVVDGLPASRAGLQSRDIIVSIDGKNVTNATLRDVLNEKEPGQNVKVRILRKGERKDVEMVLEAYDASKLGIATAPEAITLDGFPGQTFALGGSGSPEQQEEARRAMEQAMRAMEEARAQLQGPQGDALRQAHDEMRRALEELRESHAHAQGQWLGHTSDGSGRFYVVPSPPQPPTPDAPASPSERAGTLTPSAPRGYQVFRDPVGPTSAAEAERMAQLEQRLNELNGRLDKLDDRIGRLLDRLERDQ